MTREASAIAGTAPATFPVYMAGLFAGSDATTTLKFKEP